MRLRFATVLGFALAAACSGPTSPPRPPDQGPATAPVIRAINVPTSRVEAGQDITITAIVEDAETPLTQLAFQWATSAGTITGSGTTATWTIPKGITAGVDVTVTLTVTDTYNTIVNNQLVQRQFTVPGTSAPFRVHDSEAEVRELSRKFLIDLFGNSAIPPESCLVDFTDVGRCAVGKSKELDDIREHRKQVVVLSAKIFAQSVTMHSGTEATVVSEARFDDHWLNPPPGQNEFDHTHADFILTAIYDQGRWWLCESRWCCERAQSQYLNMLRAKRAMIKK